MLKISFARYEIKEGIALSILQTNLFQKHQEISFAMEQFVLILHVMK